MPKKNRSPTPPSDDEMAVDSSQELRDAEARVAALKKARRGKAKAAARTSPPGTLPAMNVYSSNTYVQHSSYVANASSSHHKSTAQSKSKTSRIQKPDGKYSLKTIMTTKYQGDMTSTLYRLYRVSLQVYVVDMPLLICRCRPRNGYGRHALVSTAEPGQGSRQANKKLF